MRRSEKVVFNENKRVHMSVDSSVDGVEVVGELFIESDEKVR